ncbi:hypothetical protein Tco_1132957 [Tanacetum coccineum]|uniref:Uncharacterized protein n=1 Tax=Tanacetum coccineum TaxID=301880 RepID=A0ABQ5JE22_9ASTR
MKRAILSWDNGGIMYGILQVKKMLIVEEFGSHMIAIQHFANRRFIGLENAFDYYVIFRSEIHVIQIEDFNVDLTMVDYYEVEDDMRREKLKH